MRTSLKLTLVFIGFCHSAKVSDNFHTLRRLQTDAPSPCSQDSDCDDGNDLTIDTCNVSIGACDHICDDGNACTKEAWVNGVCQYVDAQGNPDGVNGGVIWCDDNDFFTVDMCVPSSGCVHIKFPDDLDSNTAQDELGDFIDNLPLDAVIYINPPNLAREENKHLLSRIMNWIKVEVNQIRTPFCWKRSYGRGVGEVLTRCIGGKEKIGALCYTPCSNYDDPSRNLYYSRQGTLDCQQECKSGWRDDGLFCRKTEYGRPSYPWKFGDGLNDKDMWARCRKKHGSKGCEKWGAIVYAKCKKGYKPFLCCICRPSFSSCAAEGYTTPRLDLSCAVKIKLGDPTPLKCAAGLEQNGALCYPKCRSGFKGIGPVCWQECDTDQVGCGAGCASSDFECTAATIDQISAPFIAAINIATLGVSSPATATAKTVVIGGKLYQASTKAGKALLWAGTKLDKVTDVGKVIKMAKGTDEAFTLFGNVRAEMTIGALKKNAFAEEFVVQTSQAISDTIDSHLSEEDAWFAKQTWGDIQFREMAETEGWNIASVALQAMSIVDPSGIVGVIAAYTKPKCLSNVPFPTCTDCAPRFEFLNNPPEAACSSVHTYTDRARGCIADVSGRLVGDGSTDLDEADFLEYHLSPEGPYNIGNTPVTMTVSDGQGGSDTCTATISVSDITPTSITCPRDVSFNNTLGHCSGVATFPDPNVTNNCDSTSTTMLFAGLPSGSQFPVGTTINTFENVDSLGNEQSCSFKVSIFDVDAPSISCTGLTPPSALDNDPGKCGATHMYTEPLPSDNCPDVHATGPLKVHATPSFADSYTAAAKEYTDTSALLDPIEFAVGTTTSAYVAVDEAGNTASCDFVVTVNDVEAPSLGCPVESIRPCGDISPSVTGVPEIDDNCDGAPAVSFSDDARDGIDGNCPQITTRTWAAEDWSSNENRCTQKIIEIPPDALTTRTHCVLTEPFCAIFTPDGNNIDGNNIPNYKLTATNPGQFSYNIFHNDRPGTPVTFTVNIPYPFVTQGATPVYAYDWLDLVAGTNANEHCFMPKTAAFFLDATKVTMQDYGQNPVCGTTTHQASFTVTVPGTGFVYLSVHLEVGLKLTGNVKMGGSNNAMDDKKRNMILPDARDFGFSVVGPTAASNKVQNYNVFKPAQGPGVSDYKRNPGVAGVVLDRNEDPVKGVTMTLMNSNGRESGSEVTDIDGFYRIVYKHKGKAAKYSVRREDTSEVKYVTLKGNDFGVVDFL